MEGTYPLTLTVVHQTPGSRIQGCTAPVKTQDLHAIPSTMSLPDLCCISMLHLHPHPVSSTTSGPCPSPITPLLASQAWAMVWSCPPFPPTWRLQPTFCLSLTSSQLTTGSYSSPRSMYPAHPSRTQTRRIEFVCLILSLLGKL